MKVVIALVVSFCMLVTSSCGLLPQNPNKVIDALEAVSAVSEAAVIGIPLLSATGLIPPSIAAIIASAAQNTAATSLNAIDEENSADTNPVKLQKIGSMFLSVAINTTGMPAQAAAYMIAIKAAIDQLMVLLKSEQVVSLANAHPNVKASGMLTRYDKKRLAAIHEKNKAVIEKAKVYTTKPVAQLEREAFEARAYAQLCANFTCTGGGR